MELVEALPRQRLSHEFESFVAWFREMTDRGISIETLEREKVAVYHRKALNHMLEYVWRNNAFYRGRLEQAGLRPPFELDWEQAERIPCLTKEEMQDNFRAMVCHNQLAQIHPSTGTTGGKPVFVGYTLFDLYKLDLAPQYPLLMDHVKNTVVAIALPYEMSSSGQSFHRVFQFVLDCSVLPVGKAGSYSQPEKAIAFMLNWKVGTLVTSPSYAITLAETAAMMDVDVKRAFKLTHIFLTGEGASHSLRKRIEQLWSCAATTIYGSLEVGLIGIECAHQNGLHMTEGHIHLEVIDPGTGTQAEPGQTGEVVITTLMREGMPMLRYQTGDLAYVDERKCDCGVAMPRLQLRGRMGDQLKLSSGEFSPFYLEELLMQIQDVGNWYRFLIQDGALTVEVEAAHADVDHRVLTQTIQSRLEYYMNLACAVQVVDRVPRDAGKAKRVCYL